MTFTDKLYSAIMGIPNTLTLDDDTEVIKTDTIEFHDGTLQSVSEYAFRKGVTVKIIKGWGNETIRRVLREI